MSQAGSDAEGRGPHSHRGSSWTWAPYSARNWLLKVLLPQRATRPASKPPVLMLVCTPGTLSAAICPIPVWANSQAFGLVLADKPHVLCPVDRVLGFRVSWTRLWVHPRLEFQAHP